ncbi:MAG: alpha/beta hydrolase family protein, partial [Gemmatimonadales bacterium]
TSADYAEDIRAALAYLRTRREVDAGRLGVVGHSEGGLIGPMVAVAEPSLRAVVTLAGPAYNGLEIIRYQQRNAVDRDSTLKPSQRDSAYRAAASELDTMMAASPWLKFFVSYDPLATARRVKAPALILQGETDHQVTAVQAEKLGAAMRAGGNRDVTVRVFPQLNHLFIHDSDGSVTGYARLPTNKVDPAVLGAIADWLVVKLAAKGSM